MLFVFKAIDSKVTLSCQNSERVVDMADDNNRFITKTSFLTYFLGYVFILQSFRNVVRDNRLKNGCVTSFLLNDQTK